MSSLNQIRESLASLQSYNLPERYEPLSLSTNNNNGTSSENYKEGENVQPLLDPETIERYRSARSNYLRSQITNQILEHLNTIQYDQDDENCSNPLIQFPESSTEEERDELRNSTEAAKENLCRSVSQVKQSYEGVYHKYQSLVQKRQDLANIVQDMESKGQTHLSPLKAEIDVDGDGDNDGQAADNDDIMDQTELELQDEKVKSLLAKRSMLEAKLRKVRMETEQVSSRISSKKSQLQEMIDLNNPRGGSSSPTTVLDVDNLDAKEIEAETEQMRSRTKELTDMSYYYESKKSVLEEISGIKFLSVTDAKQSKEKEEARISPRKTSPRQTRRHSLDRMEDAICLKVLLLNHHVVEITLGNSGRLFAASVKNSGPPNDCFRVVSARLTTSSVLSDSILETEEFENNPTPTVSITIPPLDDLVSLAANLEPVQDLRFVLRETLARIRILSARMNELAQLRTKYLTKITNPSRNKVNYGFGGEDQEIFCSLPSQVTVVLRLTADCPILKGSAYIHQIVGCGGWEDAVLQRIKARVNEKRSMGPMDLMDNLVEEISRAEQEDGVKIPKTPTLPKRKK